MFHIGIATQHPPLPNANEMSEIGIDFLQACVTLDPTERPSATELIEHPWLAHLTEGGVSIFDFDWMKDNSSYQVQEDEAAITASGGSSTLVNSLESQQKYYEKYQQEHYEDRIDEEGGAEYEGDAEGEVGNEISLNDD